MANHLTSSKPLPLIRIPKPELRRPGIRDQTISSVAWLAHSPQELSETLGKPPVGNLAEHWPWLYAGDLGSLLIANPVRRRHKGVLPRAILGLPGTVLAAH